MFSRKSLNVSFIPASSCTLCNATQQRDLSLIDENKENEKFATEWFDVKNEDKPMELLPGKQRNLNSKWQVVLKPDIMEDLTVSNTAQCFRKT
jgi:hypothetical protein